MSNGRCFNFVAFLFVMMIAMTSASWAETIKPDVRLFLQVPESDVQDLRAIVERFAEQNAFVVNDVGANLPPKNGRKSLYLVLNKNHSIELLVTDFLVQNQFFIAFYEFSPTPEFDHIVADFESRLNERWPNKLTPYIDF